MHNLSELRCALSSGKTLRTLIERFEKSVSDHPSKLAIICTHQPHTLYSFSASDNQFNEEDCEEHPEHLRWTYQSLYAKVQCFARALTARRLAKGSPLFIICPNEVEYLIATLSAYYVGLVHVPINPKNISNMSELECMVQTVLDTLRSEEAVLIAHDPNIAKAIDLVNVRVRSLKIIVDGSLDGWSSFEDVMNQGCTPKESHGIEQKRVSYEESSIFFTSGTTSFPKGCLAKPAGWMNVLEDSLSIGAAGPGDSVLVTVPNNHGFGYICMILPLLRGVCVVFAGPKFDPRDTITAIRQEKCTHVPIVPSMAYALLEDESLLQQTIDSVKVLLFAGSTLTKDILVQCRSVLRAACVENFYGMTEGVYCSTGPVKDLDLIASNQHIAIGRPVSGSHVRICAPGERSAIPKGTAGEIHYSSHTLVHGYIGVENDDFYETNGSVWFATGDQGFIDSQDRLFITGRYKDIIIRGGENISPAQIEGVLSGHPELRILEPQIVAAADPVAGDIPVAIVRRDIEDNLVKMLQDAVRSELGQTNVPTQVISLRELGLEDYPKTMAGKIQKSKLKEILRNHYHSTAQAGDPVTASSDIAKRTVEIWARVLGLQPNHIDIHSPVSNVADSIVQLIVRDRIRKAIGRSVPISKWHSARTIAEQITVLEQALQEENSKPVFDTRNQRPEPPSVGEIVYLHNDPQALQTTRSAVEKTIASCGLSWGDVEDVIPCTDYMQAICKSRVVNTYNIRSSIISKSANTKQMRTALESALAMHPILISFIIDDDALGQDLAVYATIRQEKSILDQCIIDYGTVDSLQSVRSIVMNYPFKDHAMLPGPSFRALIVFVRETNSAALITNISHAVLDATYLALFHEDIDNALSNRPLRPHVPFKAWADSYYNLRTSALARKSVEYHVSHLKDLGEHRHALWPHPTRQLTVSPDRAEVDGHFMQFAAPGFLRLRNRHPTLTPPVVLKAALALLAVYHTNHTHAVFISPEANRSRFPFTPPSLAEYCNLDAADVAGPTVTGILNLVEYLPNETVLDYLHRIQTIQEGQTKHACVPWHEVCRIIGCPAVDVLSAVTESLVFDWVPGLGAAALGENPFTSMQVSQVFIRTKIGMGVLAGMGSPDGSQIVLHLQGALPNTSTLWTTRAAERMKNIALWLAEEKSWGLPVSQFVRVADSLAGPSAG